MPQGTAPGGPWKAEWAVRVGAGEVQSIDGQGEMWGLQHVFFHDCAAVGSSVLGRAFDHAESNIFGGYGEPEGLILPILHEQEGFGHGHAKVSL